MKKFGILTLGCRVNQYESQAVCEKLEKEGFVNCDFNDDCDIYIINTCSVTADSDYKSRKMIRRAMKRKSQNPDIIVVGMGCYLQSVKDEAAKDELLSQVDYICGNKGKINVADKVIELVKSKEKTHFVDIQNIDDVRVYENMIITKNKYVRTYVKIQDGCNNFCSYCRVPYVRGRVRSRSFNEVYDEISKLCDNGFNEIVLTGIELSAYGEDFDRPMMLLELVQKLSEIKGLKRLRFGSLKPSLLTDEFCKSLSKLSCVMPHFHLSIQSGSNDVLSRMKRKYTKEDLINNFNTVYKYFPNACLGADIICGFPGESDVDFEDSLDIIKYGKLLHTHIFPYSPRKGTPAAKFENQLPDLIKKERCAKMASAAKTSEYERIRNFTGREFNVLIETIKNGKCYGYTENFIFTCFEKDENDYLGLIKKVKLTDEIESREQVIVVHAI